MADELKQRIAGLLSEAGIAFKSDVAVEGVRADFGVTDQDGNFIIIEAKTWEPNRDNLSRAARQAKLYAEATKAARAYVVVGGLERGDPEEGVLSTNEVVGALRPAAGGPAYRSGAPGVVRRFQPPERIVFAAMPFAPEYDDVFFIAMSHAAKSINAVCRRVDHQDFGGDIVAEIKRLLRASIAVIADLSDSRPNVLYEVGYAHALERPTVHICSTPLDRLPFDVRNLTTLPYTKGQTFSFRERLSARLTALVENKADSSN